MIMILINVIHDILNNIQEQRESRVRSGADSNSLLWLVPKYACCIHIHRLCSKITASTENATVYVTCTIDFQYWQSILEHSHNTSTIQ